MTKKKAIILLSALCLLNFILLTYLMKTNNLSWLDNSIYNFISPLINTHTTSIMKAITILGNAQILIPITLIVIVLTWKRKKYEVYGQMLLFLLVSSDLLTVVLKNIFHRLRPDILQLITEPSYSFPSAHALISFCFYGFLLYIISVSVKKKWKYIVEVLLCLLIFSIGLSRIYLGVHYASDVIAGYSMGFVWLSLIICAMNKKEK